MPTGYTHKIATGEMTTLREYALEAAKAFVLEMRDAAPGARIPEQISPGDGYDYHLEQLAEARDRFDVLRLMSIEERARAALASNEANNTAIAERKRNREAQRNRYDTMLKKTKNWEGPKALKDFMIEQLIQSVNFDCDDTYEEIPRVLTVAEWYADALNRAAKDIGYHETELAKVKTRAAETNAWLAQLWASLPAEEPTP